MPSERTRAGLDLARAKGKRLGRPSVSVNAATVRNLRAEGVSFAEIARRLDTFVGTVFRAVKN